MAKYLVKCRYCGELIDREKSTDWKNLSPKSYVHISCCENRKDIVKKEKETPIENQSELSMKQWFEELYEFLRYDLKYLPNFKLIESQFKGYCTKKENPMTPKGVYFAVRYFYEIKKGDWTKANGGIGIVPYVYEESVKYWNNQQVRQTAILTALEEQVKTRQAADRISVKKNVVKPKKTKVKNFEDLDKEE